MSIETEYEFKLDELRKEILKTPKKDRLPLKIKFAKINNELKDLRSHFYISECEFRRICNKCGVKEYGIFKILKNKNIQKVDYQEFNNIRNNFNKFIPTNIPKAELV